MGYYYETHLKDGSYVATLPAFGLQGEWFLGQRDQARFTVPLYDNNVTRSAIEEGVHEVYLFRDDIDDPIYVGPIWDIQISSQDKRLDVSSEGLESYFEFRRVNWDLVYNLWNRGEIAWDLIRRTQLETNGDLRITKGVVESAATTTNQQYRDEEGTMVLEAINALGEVTGDGFEYKIFPDRTFNTWTPKRGSQTPIATLEYGEDSGFTRYAMGYDAKFMANNIRLTGPEGSFPTTAIDTVTRTKYGLMERQEEMSEARNQQELVARADYILQARKYPRFVPTVVLNHLSFDPFNGPYQFGDVFNIVIDDGYVQYDTPMRYVGFQLSVSGQDQTSVNMYLNDLREMEEA